MIRTALCVLLPWHQMTVIERLGAASQRWRCSCGRDYGVNADAGVILPWREVSDFHERTKQMINEALNAERR